MSVFDDDPVRDLADRAIRESLQDTENLRSFLEQAVPDLAPGFDFSRVRSVGREFPLDDWRRREADLVFEIPYRVGTRAVPALVCILLEHQSDTDPLMPLRLLFFAVLHWDRQWREWEQTAPPRPTLRLHPVLPIVLCTGERPWGSNRRLVELLDEPAAFHAFAPAWQPLFWNLADVTADQLLQTGREWLQTLAVVRAADEGTARFAIVFEEAIRRVAALHGRNHVPWYDLRRIVLTYAFWQRPEQERPALLAAAEAAHDDLARREEIRKMSEKIGMTMVERLRKELREEARKELREEARKEVREEVRLQTLRSVLRTFFERRFGPLPEDFLQRIAACDDPVALENAVGDGWQYQTLADVRLESRPGS